MRKMIKAFCVSNECVLKMETISRASTIDFLIDTEFQYNYGMAKYLKFLSAKFDQLFQKE